MKSQDAADHLGRVAEVALVEAGEGSPKGGNRSGQVCGIETTEAAMGVEFLGENPTSKEGKYFARTWDSWTPLCTVILGLCPNETEACRYWLSNDEDGLDAGGAVKLADALDDHLATGRAQASITRVNAESESRGKTKEDCTCRRGSGDNKDKDPVSAISLVVEHLLSRSGERSPSPSQPGGKCRWCGGRGWNFKVPYNEIAESDLREFIRFLRASGGFFII